MATGLAVLLLIIQQFEPAVPSTEQVSQVPISIFLYQYTKGYFRDCSEGCLSTTIPGKQMQSTATSKT